MGDVNVTRTSDGKLLINIPTNLRADWEEGAKVTKMTLREYAHEQVLAGEEIAHGGTGGLTTSEGRAYR